MKPYQKPELYYENFALTQRIAGCDLVMNFSVATAESGCRAQGTWYGETITHGFVQGTCEQVIYEYCYQGSQDPGGATAVSG